MAPPARHGNSGLPSPQCERPLSDEPVGMLSSGLARFEQLQALFQADHPSTTTSAT